ncbi:cryptochrome/photolyase family protein [Aurantivibrio plasticivorans]
MSTTTKEIRFIFGDQLNHQHSWFSEQRDDVLYAMAELPQEMTYVKHHAQKIAAFFLAMRAFADSLKQSGHRVEYFRLNDSITVKEKARAEKGRSTNSCLASILSTLYDHYQPETILFQRPDEWRLLAQVQNFQAKAKTPVAIVDTEHFLLPFDEINQVFPQGKHKKMEFFYRMMRKRFDLLMEEGEPEAGRWNFDSENRKKLSKQDLKDIPEPKLFSNDATDIYALLDDAGVERFGVEKPCIDWPVTRDQSLELLAFFCDSCLPLFGKFQDAMTDQNPNAWSLYHSRLSFSINAKLLHPREVIDTAIDAYRNRSDIDLAQVEGFVRQILGWREFVRGIYWANMPEYATQNNLNANAELPDFFWDGDTDMNCLKQSIGQSLDHAYAHHIQRLMIIGNYCLLAGINPDHVDAWYLGVYADALEWVQLPNTRGMSQFADGGIVGTKPYAASGAYVNRMSDYCKSCQFNVKETVGDNACPINGLYWQFLDRHADTLGQNPRMAFAYKNWWRKSDEEREIIVKSAYA